MATYPESPIPNYPLTVTPRWDTVISRMDGGSEQRRQKTLFPVYDVQVSYTALTNAGMQTIWNFFMVRKGRTEAFYIYDLALLGGQAFAHSAQFVGYGDDSTDTFDIPGRSTSNRKVYVDGAEQTSGISYTTGTGASLSDQVVFTTAPAAGEVITADFSGFLRMRVRFANDTFDRELFMTTLMRAGVSLQGLSEYAT